MSDPVIRRVRRSIDEAKTRGGMQAGMPKVTIDAGDAERLCIVVEALATTQAENEALRAQLNEAEEKGRVLMDMCRFWKARVAQMHEAAHELYAWCVENLTAEQIKEGLPAGHKIGQLIEFERPAVEAFILRKQAEAVEEIVDADPDGRSEDGSALISVNEIWDYAQRLRQQADEIERAGGEQ